MVICTFQNAFKLNNEQAIGNHKSYKIAIEQPLWEIQYVCDS